MQKYKCFTIIYIVVMQKAITSFWLKWTYKGHMAATEWCQSIEWWKRLYFSIPKVKMRVVSFLVQERLNESAWASCHVGHTVGNIETISGLQSSHWEIHMTCHFHIGKYVLTRDREDKSSLLKFQLGNINTATLHDLTVFPFAKIWPHQKHRR